MKESNLAPLSEWRRVADHRLFLLNQRANVQIYTNSRLSMEDIYEYDAARIAIATGATWRTDFIGLQHRAPVKVHPQAKILSVDELLSAAPDHQQPLGSILIYDDDHYYLASAIAEQLASNIDNGASVSLVTPANDIAEWTHNTLEHEHIQIRLRKLGVNIVTNKYISAIQKDSVTLRCTYVDTPTELTADVVIPVTSRAPTNTLYSQLNDDKDKWQENGIKQVDAVGDCHIPATLAMAVYAGHEYARGLDKSPNEANYFRRELGLGGE